MHAQRESHSLAWPLITVKRWSCNCVYFLTSPALRILPICFVRLLIAAGLIVSKARKDVDFETPLFIAQGPT